ncbi:carbohydrate ABC transporter permease [Chelatococcus asaccharovorans]|uniref:sn-glycerol-3-phosphate transport system permease protein UgpE n=1 Tax=Chelatococcus asaccharovorans TaxID=28210 RepID=A0A2V3U3Q2_9HYPH|nr:carbohydrate ABC transporter permease [Chelatococcus asaccharovorans]MBS7702877.1 carbohydrate ABC transporter permease [Chelatococcus asaccharovorans]PXW57177.1 carbohydrate ABC transporter membrane protein 2 (CUT1 family) [Chelatococcus asaccharovorans]CAH1673635.1 Carbohydrate ABC transporter membrane protein 2 (CUT1 family) [Chelatococcus asaccharovorans]CAH1674989.1 Carbohydrate ABC transporter membrane protein 2 (CUT1 family) [Chelatococcus asaccharovorans]
MTASEQWWSERGRFIVLFGLSAIWLLPVVLLTATSLKTQGQLYEPMRVLPQPVAWENYWTVMVEAFPFARYMLNSLVVSVLSVAGDVLSSAFIAYGFAQLRFPGRRALFLIMLSTMMFPFAVRMIPLFLIFKQLGWINTYYPLIIPSYLGTHAFFIFLLHQFFRGLPKALIESARIDGANELQIWWKVVLPLSKPALAVVAILAFEQSWGDFLSPLLYINDTSKYTLPLGLYSLITGDDVASQWHLVMAGTVTMILPVIIIFALAQRFFVRGITLSGMKG